MVKGPELALGPDPLQQRLSAIVALKQAILTFLALIRSNFACRQDR